MVFYFTCSDPQYVIYMGRDKYENESLIAYGWPEDLWFHVDGHSSAHVYLRLPQGESIEDVPSDIVVECAQLTKLNSIAGCKLNHVKIVYCMWANLRKTGDMATGQIGYHNRGACKYITIEKRINEIVNRLNKSKEEKHNDPLELYELRKKRERVDVDAGKQASREVHRNLALEKEMERARQATRVETVYGWANVDEEELERADQEQMDRIMESMANRSKSVGALFLSLFSVVPHALHSHCTGWAQSGTPSRQNAGWPEDPEWLQRPSLTQTRLPRSTPPSPVFTARTDPRPCLSGSSRAASACATRISARTCSATWPRRRSPRSPRRRTTWSTMGRSS